jgi:3-phenylpropionate/trans-cinnamate dioxygenase ferredoxin reductase subunit
MADRRVDFLLIGGGVAAASCARTLREQGAEGSILVVGREQDPPYERPPLSKGYLAEKSSRDDALFLPASWWNDNDVELLTRVSAMKLDVEARVAKLSSREEVEFGQALIATGANVRRLRADGSDLDGIHYLRAFGNADAIRDDAASAGRVVLIGGSYIGCELAATLTALGHSCAILMQEDVTLERVLGPEVGRFVQRGLEEHGVEVHGSDELGHFEGDGERVAKVVSRDGLELDCGCVAIGAGVAPDVMLARSAGLELGSLGGVACNSRLETSVPGIYAAGDVADWDSALHGGPALVEHWEVAVAHGSLVAENMLGAGRDFDTVPYFWSDLADWASLEYVGIGPGEAVVRGSLEDGDFTAFYLDGERVVGAATSGRSGDLDHARRMIRERATPGREALEDAGKDLADL